MDMNYTTEDSDSDEEMIGLLSPKNGNKKKKSPGKIKKKTTLGMMKPLEILHSSQEFRVKLDGSDDPSPRNAFHVGLLLAFLSVCGVIPVATAHPDEFVTTTALVRWHKLKIKDIKQWCLDVSVQVKGILLSL